ncbi:hypothetical protein J1N35_033952 [Gossypium stocksii]|uniref:RNase H type-1 domain-containing protein n=1 Tax=Gossypium stocksii TaxID=47602 RepID=A0A9D3UR62_9ROSI|nr:hypothetical protein J1N35_033952 [Gossypium stocksii]
MRPNGYTLATTRSYPTHGPAFVDYTAVSRTRPGIRLCGVNSEVFRLSPKLIFLRFRMLQGFECQELNAAVVVHFLKSMMIGSHPCYTLVKDCLELIKGDWILEIRHIFCEDNRCVDWLVNMAHDASYGVTIFDAPPQQVKVLMEEDMFGFGTLRP